MAKEAKHTPGKWQRDGSTVYALNAQGTNRMVVSVMGGFVYEPSDRAASPSQYERVTDEEIAANARLIAAAPELLEALNWAMKRIGEPRLIKGQNDHHFNAWHAAKDAFAKAEGRSDAARKEN